MSFLLTQFKLCETNYLLKFLILAITDKTALVKHKIIRYKSKIKIKLFDKKVNKLLN